MLFIELSVKYLTKPSKLSHHIWITFLGGSVSPDGARYSRSLLVIGWSNGLWNISYGGEFGTLGGNCSGSWGIDPFLIK
jgi:hypothetical protein